MNTNPNRLVLERYKHVVVLTGAGVSAPSGLSTYRGPRGLWTRPTEPGGAAGLDISLLERDPDSIWRALRPLRRAVAQAEPNAAHRALADAERQAAGRFTVVTQNVDGLHGRAGQRDLLELHGSVLRTRCAATQYAGTPFADAAVHERAPRCELCDGPLRPDVVLFGEMLPAFAEHNAKRALRDVDLFIAVGTSGSVSPASNYVRAARYVGARTVFVNVEAPGEGRDEFDQVYLGSADVLLPWLLA